MLTMIQCFISLFVHTGVFICCLVRHNVFSKWADRRYAYKRKSKLPPNKVWILLKLSRPLWIQGRVIQFPENILILLLTCVYKI